MEDRKIPPEFLLQNNDDDVWGLDDMNSNYFASRVFIGIYIGRSMGVPIVFETLQLLVGVADNVPLPEWHVLVIFDWIDIERRFVVSYRTEQQTIHKMHQKRRMDTNCNIIIIALLFKVYHHHCTHLNQHAATRHHLSQTNQHATHHPSFNVAPKLHVEQLDGMCLLCVNSLQLEY